MNAIAISQVSTLSRLKVAKTKLVELQRTATETNQFKTNSWRPTCTEKDTTETTFRG